MDLKALQKLSYGMYVVSSKKGDKFNGQIATTVFQVAAEPPIVGISINKQNLTHEFISDSKLFSVSVLSKDVQMPYIGLFGFKSGKTNDKFKECKFKVGNNGVPIALEYAISYIECDVTGSYDAGTHTVFFGKVINSEVLNEKEPMTYEYYHNVKKGLSPKTAPTYIPKN